MTLVASFDSPDASPLCFFVLFLPQLNTLMILLQQFLQVKRGCSATEPDHDQGSVGQDGAIRARSHAQFTASLMIPYQVHSGRGADAPRRCETVIKIANRGSDFGAFLSPAAFSSGMANLFLENSNLQGRSLQSSMAFTTEDRAVIDYSAKAKTPVPAAADSVDDVPMVRACPLHPLCNLHF